MNKIVIINHLNGLRNDIKSMYKTINNMDCSHIDRIILKKNLYIQETKLTQLIDAMSFEKCENCKFLAVCAKSDYSTCNSFEPSQIFICEDCVSKEICFRRQNILKGEVPETNYFGQGEMCKYFIKA